MPCFAALFVSNICRTPTRQNAGQFRMFPVHGFEYVQDPCMDMVAHSDAGFITVSHSRLSDYPTQIAASQYARINAKGFETFTHQNSGCNQASVLLCEISQVMGVWCVHTACQGIRCLRLAPVVLILNFESTARLARMQACWSSCCGYIAAPILRYLQTFWSFKEQHIATSKHNIRKHLLLRRG